MPENPIASVAAQGSASTTSKNVPFRERKPLGT